ncbi:hypothetical protein FRC00_013767 [Tulasnella sp. 408]|nr:hypothetical protein FRC00_013767 [Tulasnella sp. 408]
MENQLPQHSSSNTHVFEDDDDDNLYKPLSTKDIHLPHFKIQTLLDAYGSPWAPQEETDVFDAVEAIATSGLLEGSELLDSKDEAGNDSQSDPDEKGTRGSGTSANKRHKRATEGNAMPPPIGKYRLQELTRQNKVMAGDAKPYDHKDNGQQLASLRLKQVKTSTVVNTGNFSTCNDAKRSKPGFVGIKDKGNREPAANPTTTVSETSIPIDDTWMPGLLQKLLRAGYQYVASDVNVNMPIKDADGLVVGVIAGIPTGLRKYKCDIDLAIEALSKDLGNHAEDGGRCGDFKCAEYGVSYGNGQPTPMQFATDLSQFGPGIQQQPTYEAPQQSPSIIVT